MRRIANPLVAAALAASLLFIPAGCKSPKEKAGEKALSQASTFQQRLNVMPGEIDTAVTRLVAATSGQNAKRADDVRAFQTSLTQMRENAALVRREAERATADASKYFQEWVREANRTKPAERAAMDEQIAARRQNYDIALEYLGNARRDYTKLVTAMEGVNAELSKDQSETAVLKVQPMVQDAIMQAQNVRNYVARLNDSINAALSKK